jgi:hypothetical protein
VRRLAGTVLVLGAAALGGCNLLDPFPTTARGAQTGQPAGERVGICYNTLNTTLAQVRDQAQQQCAAGATAEPARCCCQPAPASSASPENNPADDANPATSRAMSASRCCVMFRHS